MKIYTAGPMRGIPAFNFPAFNDAAMRLRWQGHSVFNPAERDAAVGFDPSAMTGNENLAEHGFNLRKALHADTSYISLHAEAVAVLPGWEQSSGARAEVALAHALGLIVAPIDAFQEGTVDAKDLILPELPASGTLQRKQPDEATAAKLREQGWRVKDEEPTNV